MGRVFDAAAGGFGGIAFLLIKPRKRHKYRIKVKVKVKDFSISILTPSQIHSENP